MVFSISNFSFVKIVIKSIVRVSNVILLFMHFCVCLLPSFC